MSDTQQKISLDELNSQREKFFIQEQLILKKALESNNVNDIFKAQTYIKELQKREKTESKSLLVDPMMLDHSAGYKDKPYSLSYDVLRGMSKTHVIKSIIATRKEQVQAFCQPQKDKYSTGFIIQKKRRWTMNEKEDKLTKTEENRIEDIINFLLSCGNTENVWHADTFDVFISKIVEDSLTLDQCTWENVRNRGGDLIEFFATDAATYRVADSYDDDFIRTKEVSVKGYTPSHVQIYMNRIVAEFYPWELGFGVRNPSTDIRLNGYGKSELEDMIQIVTAILNSDHYNANFFKVGSSPKGILKYTGNINQNTVEDFRRQWMAQVAGVANMHKIPIINADKLDFINTHVPNKDMEFSKYQEFLIKISCALYKIDPSEIGFPMQGSSDAKPMFEGNNEARLKYSKDKGLKPLLKRIEFWINKWLVSQLDKNFEFRFVGIESDKGEKDDLDEDIERLGNFMTFDEIRAKWNLEPMPDGNGTIIGNPIYYQNVQAKAMQAQNGDDGANGMMDDIYGGSEEGAEKEKNNPFTNAENNSDENEENNPFMKALKNELPGILS